MIVCAQAFVYLHWHASICFPYQNQALVRGSRYSDPIYKQIPLSLPVWPVPFFIPSLSGNYLSLD